MCSNHKFLDLTRSRSRSAISVLLIAFVIILTNSSITSFVFSQDFNKWCNSTVVCNEKKFLTCGPINSCICKSLKSNVQLVFKWDHRVDSCVLIPKKDAIGSHKCAMLHKRNDGIHPVTTQPICTRDSEVDCPPSIYGVYTKCNLESCSCECATEWEDQLKMLRKVVKINGKCYLSKELDDYCETDEECQLIIGPNSICSPNYHHYGYKTCNCGSPLQHIKYGTKQCLNRVQYLYNETCVTSQQCPSSSSSPDKSYCDPEEKVCKCNNGTRLLSNGCYAVKQYGEKCGSNEECVVGIGQGATCRNSFCTCSDSHYVWNSIGRNCLPKSTIRGPCQIDVQCSAILGKLARCGTSRKCECECYDDGNNNVTVDYDPITNHCYAIRTINEQCTSNVECDFAGDESNLICSAGSGTQASQAHCHCQDDSFWYSSEISAHGGFCISIGSYNSECTLDAQCTHEQALGSLSKCVFAFERPEFETHSGGSGHCLCLETYNNNQSIVGELNGSCYLKKELNEECSVVEECILGLGINTNGTIPANETALAVVCAAPSQNETTTKICMTKARAIELGTLPTPTLDDSDFPGAEAEAPWLTPTIIISASFILTIALIGLLVIYSNCKKIRLVSEYELERSKLMLRMQQQQHQPLLLRNIGQVEISEDDFVIDTDSVLGSGRNGIVYRGYFKPNCTHVAIKTNKEASSSELYLRAIFEEAKILIYLGEHKNLVQMFGICQETISRGNVYLLTELCSVGSLESFLRSNRSLFDFHEQNRPGTAGNPGSCNDSASARSSISSSANEDRSDYRISSNLSGSGFPAPKFQICQLYSWAWQIAEGMEFIASKKVIHSDLATRNILLSSVDCVKLTDFGLSRRLYESYTYLKTSKDPLPWKWLDHDALLLHLFTTHTDVWSFGITLWEIFTLGHVPYPGIMTPWCQNFIQRLSAGFHPDHPTYASAELYSLMLKCWNSNKHDRPNFTYLKEKLFVMMKRYSTKKGKEEVDDFGYLVPVETP